MQQSIIFLLSIFLTQMGFAAEKLDMQGGSNVFIQDPFSRGLERSPKYGTINNSLSEYERNDDLRSLSDLRYYRILGLFVNQSDSNKYLIDGISQMKAGINPSGYYITLGVFSDLNLSKQSALDFLSSQASFINRMISQHAIRKNKKNNYQLQYGPFSSVAFAKSSCLFLKSDSKQIDLDCDNIIKRPIVDKEKNLPINSASIGLSQAALVEYSQSAMNFDINSIAEASVIVKEGEKLGPHGFYIVRINHLGVYLASELGDKALIPPSTLPINLNIKTDISSSSTLKMDTLKPQENSSKPNKTDSLAEKTKKNLSNP